MNIFLRVLLALALFVAIIKIGFTMVRAASAGGGSKTKIEPEDVEDLDVFFVCKECGTELKVTALGEIQVPRHCGEPMEVVRRPREHPAKS